MPIKVLVADAKREERQKVAGLLSGNRNIVITAETADGRETLDMVRITKPDVVLLSVAIPGRDVLAVVEEIAFSSPDTAVIVVLDEPDLELIRRLMRTGARDYIMRPLGDDLIGTIKSVADTLQRQREAHLSVMPASQQAAGKVIAIYSPQGGAGKSVLASNLAVTLANTVAGTPERVVLVDLNLQFGDIDFILNLDPINTIAGLAQKDATSLDAELVEQHLTLHESSGLKVLVAPATPQLAESVTVYTIEKALEILRQSYDYVVVDLPSQLQDTSLAALDAANTIFLVTSLDLLAVHKTRIALDMLRRLYPPEKIQVILNRANSDVGISVQDVETAIGTKLKAQLPSDGKLVVTAVNEGKPFTLSAPNALISTRIQELATEIVGRDGKEKGASQSGGFLKRLFG